jgi:hypothetical protein
MSNLGPPQHTPALGKGVTGMLRKLRDMPAGTLGFEAVGEVDDDVVEDQGALGSSARGGEGIPGP